MIEFVKLHGAGNDYIAIDGRGIDRDWGTLSAAMSRLNFGVGGDGIVLVQPSDRAQVRMRVFNPDGSEAEMSGNGIRLFAKFVIDREIALPGNDGLIVETGGGVRGRSGRKSAMARWYRQESQWALRYSNPLKFQWRTTLRPDRTR